MEFSKPALTSRQHLELLKKRGLIINDHEKAFNDISTIGYFRLTGYMYPLQFANSYHKFKENISFELVMSYYNFDRHLRLLILGYIEHIEVALRSVISDTYADKYGPHWYLDSGLFKHQNRHSEFIAKINLFCKECEFQFIKSYTAKYDVPPEPPCWMIMETLTLGQLSLLFQNLKGGMLKSEIASRFMALSPVLESWLRSINSLRNFCAHHSRIWNRKFAIKPILPVKEDWRFLEVIGDNSNWRLYGILSCMVKMMEKIHPTSKFKSDLKGLFLEFGHVNLEYMGFPIDWHKEILWQ